MAQKQGQRGRRVSMARGGAVLRPQLAGALAGLAAGGAAAALYSFYCNQDAVLFVLPAYGAAILSVALLGAVSGRWLLRW